MLITVITLNTTVNIFMKSNNINNNDNNATTTTTTTTTTTATTVTVSITNITTLKPIYDTSNKKLSGCYHLVGMVKEY